MQPFVVDKERKYVCPRRWDEIHVEPGTKLTVLDPLCQHQTQKN